MKPTFSKILVPTAVAFSVSAGAADIDFKGRGDFNLVVDISKLEQGALVFNSPKDMMNHLLNSNGVMTDEKSKIWIRNEESKIELNCFDCLVIDSNNHYYIERPINEHDRSGGGF